MIWVDRIAQKLTTAQHIDDMFTPSGYAHIGSLRGPILHDVVYRVLREQTDDTVFTYVFNDFDVIDGLSDDLKKTHEKYMGYVLRMAPSPVEGYESFAQFYTEEMKRILNDLGVNAEYLSSWDMYHEGKFNDTIKIALDNRDKILEIYRRIGGYAKKSDDWYPLQVICPSCHKLGTTHVTGWDGTKVKFTCEKNLVTWAEGCGYTGTVSPFDGNGKFPWKVDWPAHWKNLGITLEGAGKDHASRGGSYDIAFEIVDKVFNYEKPFYFPYEFFMLGGKKMSSSKGIGASSKDIHSILPPEIFRFLIIRTPVERTIEFDPHGDTILNLFDEYDKCLSAYYDKLEGILPEGKQGEVLSDFARIAELSQVRQHSEKRLFVPRFRTVVNMIRNKSDLLGTFEQQKGAPLTGEEKEILEERSVYAQSYLKNIVGSETSYELIDSIPESFTPSDDQKLFLAELAEQLAGCASDDREELTNVIFSSMKKHNLAPRNVFKALYLILIGQEGGPKAADLILEFGVQKAIERIQKVLLGNSI
ncbi:lysine--tRNA ligase [Candidatus Microgenomates bacterium]|nr:lysine--tRNA ligase [Candidatus Microgenomates bacterium]